MYSGFHPNELILPIYLAQAQEDCEAGVPVHTQLIVHRWRCTQGNPNSTWFKGMSRHNVEWLVSVNRLVGVEDAHGCGFLYA